MNLRLPFVAVAVSAGLAVAGDWPQFRGPDGSGVSNETGIPTTWGPGTNIKWTAEFPGRSASSPVVFGKKVFVTTASGPKLDRLHVICLDAESGKTLWHRQLAATGNTGCHNKSSMAAGTPCVNADGVYCLFATADLAAFDLDGNLKWYRSLAGDYPDISNQVGMASSPVLWRDLLMVPMDSVGDSFLAAIDTRYGTNVWKVDRPKVISWVTPTIRDNGRDAEVIFASPRETVAYDAVSGKKAWSLSGGGVSVPTAVTAGDRMLVPVSGGAAYLKKDGDKVVEEWRSAKLASGYTSPLVYRGRIYVIGSAGTLKCAELNTGKELWAERIGKGKAQFWASPIAADGHIYTFDDAGNGTVVEAGDEPKIVAVNELEAEILGTPAIANGSIYIQTAKGMICIAHKK